MKRFFFAKLFLVILIASGCTFTPEKSPPPRLHDLGPLPHGSDRLPAPWSKVDVTAPEWLKDDRIRYRLVYSDATRVGVYTLDRWIAPPPELLELRFELSGDGGPLRVRIELQEFEQIFDRPDHAKALIRFRASAYDRSSKKLLAERTFELDKISPSADAAGAVVSLADLADDAIAAVRTWMEGMDLARGATGGTP
ncbi:ABC-type transport auxiliary lipoprotein family protein [Methylocaldum sp. GT1TLB]|uniref:ABC-type transport auxiliary lipoprotein family protein n=1 Tax=Methylocaldum sp. GT1TLB TaxID=3438965 RepID=UPI003DA070C2